MGITRAEFDRLLPAAVARAEGIDWRVEAVEGAERSFGLLRMPVLHVTLEVGAAASDEAQRFVERFLLAFQRAGG
jgi:hypothetical protein